MCTCGMSIWVQVSPESSRKRSCRWLWGAWCGCIAMCRKFRVCHEITFSGWIWAAAVTVNSGSNLSWVCMCYLWWAVLIICAPQSSPTSMSNRCISLTAYRAARIKTLSRTLTSKLNKCFKESYFKKRNPYDSRLYLTDLTCFSQIPLKQGCPWSFPVQV